MTTESRGLFYGILFLVAIVAACSGNQDFETRKTEALALFRSGSLDEAAEALHALSIEDSRDFDVRYYLARTEFNRTNYREALIEWEAVLLLRPAFAEGYYRKGNTLVTLKRPSEAIDAWDEALRYRPQYPEANFNIGRALEGEQNWNDAARSYMAALDGDSTFNPARLNLAKLYMNGGQYEQALVQYEYAAQINPSNQAARGEVIRCLEKLGRHRVAVQYIDECLATLDLNQSVADSLRAMRDRFAAEQ